MKRITPEEVVEAYRRFPQVRPGQDSWYELDDVSGPSDMDCGCPAFVVALTKDATILEEPDPGSVAANLMYDLYGADYCDGFVFGVDTGDAPAEMASVSALGRLDGVAAWAAVEAAGLVKP